VPPRCPLPPPATHHLTPSALSPAPYHRQRTTNTLPTCDVCPQSARHPLLITCRTRVHTPQLGPLTVCLQGESAVAAASILGNKAGGMDCQVPAAYTLRPTPRPKTQNRTGSFREIEATYFDPASSCFSAHNDEASSQPAKRDLKFLFSTRKRFLKHTARHGPKSRLCLYQPVSIFRNDPGTPKP